MAKKKGAEKTIPKVGEEVEVSTLNTLQLFTYQGEIYTKRKSHPDHTNATALDGSRLIRLPPDTLVTVVEEPSPKPKEEPGEAEAAAEPGEAEAAAGPEEEPGIEPGEAEAKPEE